MSDYGDSDYSDGDVPMDDSDAEAGYSSEGGFAYSEGDEAEGSSPMAKGSKVRRRTWLQGSRLGPPGATGRTPAATAAPASRPAQARPRAQSVVSA